jgi:NADP-reducing hydrogenase subunit HndB
MAEKGKIKTLDQLRKIREEAKKAMDIREGKYEYKIVVSMGTSGIVAGAREVLRAFLDAIAENGLSGVMVTQTGFMGSKTIEPVVIVEDKAGNQVMYGNLTPEKAKEIVERHIMKGETVKEYAVRAPVE